MRHPRYFISSIKTLERLILINFSEPEKPCEEMREFESDGFNEAFKFRSIFMVEVCNTIETRQKR